MVKTILLDELAGILQERGAATRTLTAIAGPPGAGKSRLAAELTARLNEALPNCAALLGMDGYHFDDRVLVPRGLRAKKGAPETFDVDGLYHMLVRLRQNREDEVAVPVFDRDLEIARAGALLIPRFVRHVIVEGNYLLLDRPRWTRIANLFATTIMIAVPEPILRERLTERWRSYGLSASEIEAKVEQNDLPNGRLVIDQSIDAEFIFTPQSTQSVTAGGDID
jgi:pantothenate kinase